MRIKYEVIDPISKFIGTSFAGSLIQAKSLQMTTCHFNVLLTQFAPRPPCFFAMISHFLPNLRNLLIQLFMETTDLLGFEFAKTLS